MKGGSPSTGPGDPRPSSQPSWEQHSWPPASTPSGAAPAFFFFFFLGGREVVPLLVDKA